MTEGILRLIRFGLVGCTGIIIDFSITWFCKEKWKINKFISSALGFTLAVTSNYLLNRAWTFNSTHTDIMHQFALFMLISIIGLGLNTAMLYFLATKKGWPFYLSKLLSIAVVFCWNFAANNFVTFSAR